MLINRENGPYPPLDEFCVEHNLPVLLRIPFERTIAEGVAQGKTLVDIHPEYGDRFRQILMKIAGLL